MPPVALVDPVLTFDEAAVLARCSRSTFDTVIEPRLTEVLDYAPAAASRRTPRVRRSVLEAALATFTVQR